MVGSLEEIMEKRVSLFLLILIEFFTPLDTSGNFLHVGVIFQRGQDYNYHLGGKRGKHFCVKEKCRSQKVVHISIKISLLKRCNYVWD